MKESSEVVCSTLHSAIEGHDLDRLLSTYDDNAELHVIDHSHPPSNPLALKGKEAIGNYYRDIFSRQLNHRVTRELVSDGSLAFSEECEYPDGTHVFMNSLAEIKDDKIIHEVDVQAWDESPKH